MIEGFDKALEGCVQSEMTALRGLLEELLGGHGAQGRLVEEQMLRSHAHSSRVYRLRFAINGRVCSLIVKFVKPQNTQRSELAAKRWLPAVGLGDHGPGLLASVTERSGDCVWQVYEDFGDNELNCRQPDPERVSATLQLVVQVHTRFAGHPLLGEIRMYGRELGIPFYESTVRDAIVALEACHPPEPQRPLHERLRRRLYKLHDELPARARAFEEWGGPETLLHGDLWTTNVFVIPGPNGLHARLIDWDLSGVGPVSYDVGTFLLRFAPCHRPWILEAYTEEAARAGWQMPPEQELNYLFETQEYARFSNRVIWPAIGLVQDHAPWGWEELAMVDQWFEDLKPVLALEPGRPAAA
jgi:phosphotransferase family enzyme